MLKHHIKQSIYVHYPHIIHDPYIRHCNRNYNNGVNYEYLYKP